MLPLLLFTFSLPTDEVDKDVKYKNHKVYSRDIKFVPNGRQKTLVGTEKTFYSWC